ncbi:MAG TPA: hypothetical protein VNI57_15735 [Candidatus Saccharimonadales bacterium]|nr:hypothetical protein [Candidatus Saccharimonadales bacterium]
MSDRKYRQKGYQDTGSKQEPRRGTGQRPRRPESYGPRPMNLPPSRTISRCASCGAILPAASADPGTCPGCAAALHACRQCAYFDPGSRFQCAKPVPEAIRDKSAANQCDLFALKTTVERDASSTVKKSGDARSDFDALFKK